MAGVEDTAKTEIDGSIGCQARQEKHKKMEDEKEKVSLDVGKIK